MRLIIGLIVCIFSLVSYCGSREFNPVTGEHQYIGLTTRQEIELGLQAVPEMLKAYGGLHPDQKLQKIIDAAGLSLVQNSRAKDTPWQFEFHLLKDPKTVNAFALPGGQVFITAGLYGLFSTRDQLAAVLAHEIAHVLARHSSQQIAKANLTNGLIDAVIVVSGDASTGQISAIIGQLVNMSFSRKDEVQADQLGVFVMADAGYDPAGMVELMQLLEKKATVRMPEFFSTHPNPENRIGKIEQAIREYHQHHGKEGKIHESSG
ncbi:MAG: M48 family metalloprotease [Desulfobacterales bacterium]|nr:M48 family metalloprotease [Desulfobacterales bacterium]